MLKRVLVLPIFLTLIVSSGCMVGPIAPVQPPMGAFFTQVRAPLDVDCDNTDMGSKVGQAKTMCFFHLVSVGDASVQAAAKDGGITKVKHLDYEFMNALGIFNTMKIIAYGD